MIAAPFLLGALGGAVLTPALLPWLPPRAFAAKGAIVGALLGAALALALATPGGAGRGRARLRGGRELRRDELHRLDAVHVADGRRARDAALDARCRPAAVAVAALAIVAGAVLR